MGLVKSAWIEAEERGWVEIEKNVCENCVEDEFLKEQIRGAAAAKQCDYCGRKSRRLIAAPADVVMALVAGTIGYFFCEPTQAGVPYEGGWLVDPKDTDDVVYSVGLDCHDELFADIVGSFTNDAWVPAAEGHWATPHPNEIYKYSWIRFEEWIKHETRFFFMRSSYPAMERDPHEIEPGRMLSVVAHLVRDLGLVTDQAASQRLYRVRERTGGEGWPVDAESMGAPPADKARAGRMNPAGISYLYLSFDEATAIAEVVRSTPAQIAVAEFRATRTLRILDLTTLPPEPSIFDASRREQREGLLFLRDFVKAVCEPVSRDGREHIGYVPSQVVSEFFALVFRDSGRVGLDGIAYPSTVHHSGKNLVLFPTTRGLERGFDMVQFESARESSI
jgi:RES domain-containing protein